MNPFPAPVGPLGYLRVLSPNAGVKVSPLALGTMSLGSKQEAIFGTGATKDEALKYLDIYREAGGNFIDLANMYQGGDSEILVGEWMASHQCRDEIVLASKYTYCYGLEASYARGQLNFQGNNSKSLHLSIESSLKRLKTDYIDIFYLHFWDYTTSIPEVMNALDTLIRTRKVLYLGISDTPGTSWPQTPISYPDVNEAWIVAKANEYARHKGLTPFSVYQGKWSLLERDLEAEILPMLRSEGMGLTAYGVTGSGKFKSTAEIKSREAAGNFRYGQGPTADERAISAGLEKVAAELPGKPSPASVAQAWAMSKVPYVFPMIGGASAENLKANIEALNISLSTEQVLALESVKPFVQPWPYNVWGTDPSMSVHGQQDSMFAMMPHIEFVRVQKPLGPPGASQI